MLWFSSFPPPFCKVQTLTNGIPTPLFFQPSDLSCQHCMKHRARGKPPRLIELSGEALVCWVTQMCIALRLAAMHESCGRGASHEAVVIPLMKRIFKVDFRELSPT